MAGILDGYQFDPQSYGGGLPGWLGSFLGMQPQSQGFQDQIPPAATPAMGQRGPGVTLPQYAESGYGKDAGSQNPLLGLLGGLLPGQGAGATPAAASPGPVAAPVAGPGLGDLGIGLLNRLQAGATNLGTGGNPLAGIVNAFGGLVTGQRTDPFAYQLQSQQATLKALIQAGVPPAVAQAAALNPEVLKTVAPQIYNKPDFGVIGTDQYGNPVHGFIDKTGGKVTPVSATGASGITGPGVPSANMDLHGEEFLKTLDPAKADLVKRTAEGLSPFPSGFVMKTPFGQWLTQAVGQYEPGVDANTFAARGVMRKDLAKTTPGSMGGQVTFAGTAINHLADVAKAAEALDASNGLGIAPLGHLINDVRGLTTAQAAKIAELNGATSHYGQEVTKFYAGSPGGEGERQRFLTSIGSARTKDELVGALQAERDLIPGRIAELRNRIESTLGSSSGQFTKQLDQAERGLKDIDATIARMKGISPANQQTAAPKIQEGATATNPKTGERIVFKDGKWQPVK